MRAGHEWGGDGDDKAMILSRHVAMEYSNSDKSDSEEN